MRSIQSGIQGLSPTALLLAAMLSAVSLRAQTPVGTVAGVVRDASRAIVPAARVTLRERDTSVSRGTLTDDAGRFVIANLAPGVYAIEAEHAGFATAQQTLSLRVGDYLTVDFELTVGSPTVQLEVRGELTHVNNRDSTPLHCRIRWPAAISS